MRLLHIIFLFLFPVILFGQTSYCPIPAGTNVSSSTSFSVIATNYKIGIGVGTNTTTNTDCTGANLIVVAVNTYTGASTSAPTITDNQGGANTYTNVRYDRGGTSPNYTGTAIYYCYSPTVSTTMTFSTTTTFTSLFVIAVSGSASSPLDAQNGVAGSGGSTVQPGSITPAQNGELIVDVVQGFIASTGNPSTPTSFTLIGATPYSAGNSYAAAAYYYIQTTAAAINPTTTFSNSEVQSQASISSFKHP